ncbi:MAG: flagellar basal body P-ring formation chaperone FlgA [Methylophilaceae bacterium]
MRIVQTFKKTAVLLIGLSLGLTTMLDAHAEVDPAINQIQNLSLVKKKVEDFLTSQSMGYPGKVTITSGHLDNNLRLANCPAMETFLPPGSRAWGKTSVGVRCTSPNWLVYVQANVSVMSQYLVAAAPLMQGRTISDHDFMFESGDLSQLPPGVFTDPSQAVGRIVNVSLNAGTVLRLEMLKLPPVIQQGQKVVITTVGKGFQISADAMALTTASDGQVVKAKVANGQVISGIARSGGQIEVSF